MRFHSPTLLLVEDTVGDADYVRELLHDVDDVLHVTRLSEALAVLSATTVGAILLDLRLPDGFGVELVHAIRRSARDVPIVVLTGMEDDALALACIEAGAQDYLSKQEMREPNLRRAIRYAMARTQEVSETRRADALQEHLAAIVEASSDAILSMTFDGTITSWNAGAEQIFQCPREEAVGAPLRRFFRVEGFDLGERIASISSRVAVDAEELVGVRADGTSVVLSVVVCRLGSDRGNLGAFAAICRDVTESRRRDDELRRSLDELVLRDRQMRALAARLNEVREMERTRIAREVHDELGQLLTGLKLDLAWVMRRIDVASREDVNAKLVDASAMIDATIKTVQRIATELRPAALDVLGLTDAVRDEARRFETRTGVATDLRLYSASDPEPPVATELFRILQELLTNVARHARARSVKIALHDVVPDADRGWMLRVEDDGVGIDDVERAMRSSLGLLGMKERAESLGGTFTLARGTRGGTVATVAVTSRRR